jgi:hypothetical protein
VQLEDAPLAGQRAQLILKPLLLRRTKNSTLEGKPILTLPPKDIEIVRLQFTDEEREVRFPRSALSSHLLGFISFKDLRFV